MTIEVVFFVAIACVLALFAMSIAAAHQREDINQMLRTVEIKRKENS